MSSIVDGSDVHVSKATVMGNMTDVTPDVNVVNHYTGGDLYQKALLPGASVETLSLAAKSGASYSTDQINALYTGGDVVAGAPSPATGIDGGGTVVTFTGTNMANVSAVSFGGVAGTSLTHVDAETITVVTGDHNPGVVDVVLTTDDGTITKTGAYTYTDTTPVVTTVTPNTGTAAGGTAVVITGSNFTGATAVKFPTTVGTAFSVIDDATIHVTTPAHSAGAVNVTVVNGRRVGHDGTKTNGYTYT